MLLKVYKSRVWLILFMLLPFVGNAQIPGSPWNFTNNPNSAVYAIPTTVAYNGGMTALSAGDWVGAFYDDGGVLECGGAYQWSGTNNIAVMGFGNDTLNPNKNGFWQGELVQWKFYYTATSTEVDVLSTPEFNWTNGSQSQVLEFSAATPPVATQTINYAGGFTWISFNVLPTDSHVAMVMANFTPMAGDYIKTQTGSPCVFNGTTWNPPTVIINPDRTYILRTSNIAGSFDVVGNLIDVQDPITVNSGWNWIGYKPIVELLPGVAFNSMTGTFTPNDQVKPQTGTPGVYNGTVWNPPTFKMKPGLGYRLRYQNPVSNTLIYPASDGSNAGGSAFSAKVPKVLKGDPGWEDPTGLETNMIMAVNTAELEGECVQTGKVAAFDAITDQCRGVSEFWDGGLGCGMAYVNVGFNSPENNVGTFYYQVWDSENDVVYQVVETGLYQTDEFIEVNLTLINPVVAVSLSGIVTDEVSLLPIGNVEVTATSSIPLKSFTDGDPGWEDPTGLETNMIMAVNTAELEGECVQTGKVAAFDAITDQCRGVSEFWDGGLGCGMAYVNVGFNSPENNVGTFYYQVWDSENDVVYQVVETGLYQTDEFIEVNLTLIPQEEPGVLVTFTAADGTYEFNDVPDGTWTVCTGVTTPTEGYTDECAAPVTTPPSAVVNFALLPDETCQDVVINNFPTEHADLCAGTELSYDFSGVEILNAATVTWSVAPVTAGTFDDLIFTLAPDYAGMVTITVFGEATPPCEDATAMLSFEVFALPVVTCPEFDAVCSGSDVIDFAAVPGGVYTDADDMVVTDFDPIDAGTFVFTLTVTDGNGCSAFCEFDIVVLQSTVVYAGADATIEEGETYTIADATVLNTTIILWSTDGDGTFNDATIANPTYNPGSSDIAIGQVTLQLSGGGVCPDTDSMVLTIGENPCPNPPVANAGPDMEVCQDGEAVQLNGSAEYYSSVTWTTVMASGVFSDEYILNPIYTPGEMDYLLGSVEVILLVNGLPGCDTAVQDTMIITFNELPEVTLAAYAPVCAGIEEFALYGGLPEGGIYYVDGVETLVFDPALAGEYVVKYTYTDDNGCSNFATGTIVVNELPEVTLAAYAPVCEGEEAFDLYGGMPVGGTYFVDGVEALTFNPAVAGLYDLMYTYTGENGCSNSAVGTILVNALPIVECPVIEPVCAGSEMIDFAAVTSGVYTNAAGDPVTGFNPIDAGTFVFTLTVTGANGCVGTCDFNIVVNPLPVVECPEFEDVCSGSEMIDFAVVEGGVYTNEAGDIVIGFNPEDVGVYEFTLTVTENGCEGFCTFEITVLQSAVVYAGADAFIEEGETYTISDATASYAIALLWSTDGDGTFDDNTIISPTYTPGSNDIAAKQVTLSLFGDGDCPDTDTMVLTIGENPCPNPPVVNAGEDMEVCADGEPFELDASSEFCTSYQWFTPDGLGSFSEENILNPTYTPSSFDYAAGSVELCVMAEGLSGCNAVTDCMTLTFNPLPEVTLAAYAPVCVGADEFDLYGGMPVGGTYFVDDVEALTFNPALAGLYDLMYTYTDDNGCSNSAMGMIVVNELPEVTLVAYAPVCEGEEAFDLYGGLPEGGTYFVEGVEALTFTPEMAGEYELMYVYTDENGCSNFAMGNILVNPLPTITTQPVDVEVQIGQPFELIVEAVNATGYQWYFNGAMIAGATGDIYYVASALGADAGTYYVIVSGDCGDVTSVEVTVTIAAITPETQVINFYGPVNGMSTYLELINPDMSNIFADVMDDLYYVEMKNPSKIWTPLNTSFDFNESNGAKVALNGGYPSSIEVAGYARTDNTVNLPMGGSYMPIYSRTAVSAADVFGPLGASLYAVYSMDYSGIYWPDFNIYTLQNLIPGSAYNVVMTAPGVANFDVPIVITAVAGYTNVPANLTSWKDMVLTATQHNIAISAAALSGLQIGDVIGAFTEYGQMTGMVEVTSLIDNLVLRAFGDNPATEAVEGFVEGDQITFKVWRNGVEIAAEAIFKANMPNQNVFAKDGISAVEGLKAGVTAINDLSTELTANLYPNPATDLVNINTNFVISNIKVINYVGQVIFENNPSQEDFQINTSNLVSGMYFVQIESNEGYVITKRLTIK